MKTRGVLERMGTDDAKLKGDRHMALLHYQENTFKGARLRFTVTDNHFYIFAPFLIEKLTNKYSHYSKKVIQNEFIFTFLYRNVCLITE